MDLSELQQHLKLIMLGDSGVGKSSLLSHLNLSEFGSSPPRERSAADTNMMQLLPCDGVLRCERHCCECNVTLWDAGGGVAGRVLCEG